MVGGAHRTTRTARLRRVAVLPALSAAFFAVMQTPALATASADLSVEVSDNDGSVRAMSEQTDLGVLIQNAGPDSAGTVTVDLTTTHGTMGTIDTSNIGGSCTPSTSTHTVCSFDQFVSGSYLGFNVPVSSDLPNTGNTELVTLHASIDSATSDDPGSTDNANEVSFTADRYVITHMFLYDPDRQAGTAANPGSTFINVSLKDAATGLTPQYQFVNVWDRPAGSSGNWNLEGYVQPDDNDPSSTRVSISAAPSATGLEFKLEHPVPIGQTPTVVEQFTKASRGTKVDQTVAMVSTKYGTQTALKGALVFIDNGKPVGYGGTITLQRTPHGTSAWTKVSDVSIDYANGKFSTFITPHANTDYRWRFTGLYLGGSSSGSAPIEVTVHQAVATALSPVAIPPGGTAMLTAAVKPGQAGQKVSLQQKTSSGWKTLSTRTLTADSKQTWKFHPRKTGVPSYRIVKSATSTLANGVGTSVSLLITRQGRGPKSSYVFEDSYNGHPAGWNPCHTIGFQVNTAHAPTQAVADVKETLRRISLAGGLRFRYDGTTHVIPDPYSPQREDLVVAWRPHNSEPIFQGGAVGFGGYNEAIYRSGHEVILKGYAILDADFKMTPGFGAGLAEGQLLMHELGHAMGLNHSGGNYQIMRPVLDNFLPAAMYGAGDIAGLKKIGRSQGCV